MTSFAERFRRGDRLLGALVRMPNESLVELSGLVGLDYVLLDTEHGPGDQLALAHHVTAAEANGLAVLVRVGSPAEVLRVLDLGVAGVLAPHVSDVATARAYVDAMHYPPLGRRGFAGYTRAGRYGLRTATDHHAASRSSLLIAMIEDPGGLHNARDIAAVQGVDGLMLGPADLAAELGVIGAGDPRIAAAAHTVKETATAAGLAAVTLVGAPEAATAAFESGNSVVMYNVQLLLAELFTRLASVAPGRAQQARLRLPEPLVLLPGMLGDGSVWDDVATRLADVAQPQFHRIDLDSSIPDMAESVLAAAPDRFALAGHSLGALVALEIVRRAPQRVSRLALVNASGRRASEQQLAGWSALLERLDGGGFAGIVDQLARDTLPPARRQDPALVAAGQRMGHAVGPDGLRRQLTAQLGRTSYLEVVAATTVPVLIVSGTLDEVCPPDRQQELQEHRPDAQFVSIDAGHMTPIEAPAELAAVLRSWLTT